MLKRRESLIRLIGKRRRRLPNHQSLFSTNPESSSDLLKEIKNGESSIHQIDSDLNGDNKDSRSGNWVNCPFCGNAISGDDSMINSHLDACLARGTKRKLTRTLLHFSFSPVSKENIGIGKSNKVETKFIRSSPEENHRESSIPLLPEVGDAPPLNSIVALESCKEEYVENLSSGDFINDKGMDNDIVLPICGTAKLANSTVNDASVDVLETFIVGRRFGDGVELKQGDTISLSRDPNNIKDPYAIKVLSADSNYIKVLGYIP